LRDEKKTNTANCPYTFRYYSQKTEKFVDECTICPKVWSVSQNKFIYECKTKEEFKSQTLSDCSKNSREKLVELATSLKSVSDLEKLRELLMKTCMEEEGFSY
jgi:Fe-S-cluster-containing dehydrogenase component